MANGAGSMRNPAGNMCSSSEMKRAFGSPKGAGKDVAAAGRVAKNGGMKKEPGQPKPNAMRPGPAKG